MALRNLARKLTTAPLRWAWAPCVSSPAEGSRFLSSQHGEGRRALEGRRRCTNYRKLMRDLDQVDKRTIRTSKEALQANKQLVTAINKLPRNLVLATALAVAIPTTALAYSLDAFH